MALGARLGPDEAFTGQNGVRRRNRRDWGALGTTRITRRKPRTHPHPKKNDSNRGSDPGSAGGDPEERVAHTGLKNYLACPTLDRPAGGAGSLRAEPIRTRDGIGASSGLPSPPLGSRGAENLASEIEELVRDCGVTMVVLIVVQAGSTRAATTLERTRSVGGTSRPTPITSTMLRVGTKTGAPTFTVDASEDKRGE